MWEQINVKKELLTLNKTLNYRLKCFLAKTDRIEKACILLFRMK